MSATLQLPPDVWAHVVDVHCHPTDSLVPDSFMNSLSMKICAMATKQNDQNLVRQLASAWPNKVIPCFGYHPWFTHWIAVKKSVSKRDHYCGLFLQDRTDDEHFELLEKMLPELPDPVSLEDVLDDIRSNLADFPAAMVGEVGLDRSFRVPISLSPDSPRKLSPFNVPLDHQLKILEAQLDLAVEFKRNVSFHSVKAHQATLQLIDRMLGRYGDRWDLISIDMHSCGFSPEIWKSLENSHPNIFLSLSTGINLRSPGHRTLIESCNPSRILAESDYHDIHDSPSRTLHMISIIADIKGWHIETQWNDDCSKDEWGAVQRLEENWKEFFKGNHVQARKHLKVKQQNRRFRKDRTFDMDETSDDNS